LVPQLIDQPITRSVTQASLRLDFLVSPQAQLLIKHLTSQPFTRLFLLLRLVIRFFNQGAQMSPLLLGGKAPAYLRCRLGSSQCHSRRLRR